MKKSILSAGLLAISTAVSGIAFAQPDSGIVEVKLTLDEADTARTIYDKIQRKADQVCQKDEACKQSLVDAFVEATGDSDVAKLHAERAAEDRVFQVASTERG